VSTLLLRNNTQYNVTAAATGGMSGKEEEKELSDAARKGDVEAVRRLGARVKDVDAYKDHFGLTALLWAARNGHLACVQELLRLGADAEKKSNGGRTALKLACGNSHASTAQALLLEAHANPNSQDTYGWTPLHVAAYNGYTATVQVLCEGPVPLDLSLKTDRGETALDLATEANKHDVVALLKGEKVEEGRRVVVGVICGGGEGSMCVCVCVCVCAVALPVAQPV